MGTLNLRNRGKLYPAFGEFHEKRGISRLPLTFAAGVVGALAIVALGLGLVSVINYYGGFDSYTAY